MYNSFFYGSGTNPDVIFGKFDLARMQPEVAAIYSSNDTLRQLSNVQFNKYEFWFSSTISFIPYSGESVFITDTSGNVTHTGNLLTKKNATINGDATVDKNLLVKGDATVDKNLLVKSDVTVDNNANIKGNTKIDKDLLVDGLLYVNGQNIFSILGTISAKADAAKAAADTAAAAAASTTAQAAAASNQSSAGSSSSSGGGNTTIIQQQPIYDNVKIDFVNSTDESPNRGTVNKITYNNIVANIRNGFQVGGMRSGEYVQDNKRVGIEMILSSNRAYLHPELNNGLSSTPSRYNEPAGFTTPIEISFPSPVREFRITGVDVNKTGTLDASGYIALVFYVDGTSRSFPLIGFINQSGQVEEKNSIVVTSSQSAGDIKSVVLGPSGLGQLLVNYINAGIDGTIQGTAFITYTNLFWK